MSKFRHWRTSCRTRFWNPVKNKQALFCVNERLVTYLDTVAGKCAVVKVGATCVSRIRAAYEDVITHEGKPGKVHRFDAPIPVEKGGELGRFEMGSTVILVFEPGRVKWDDSFQPEAVVRGRRGGTTRQGSRPGSDQGLRRYGAGGPG